jgi:hypothetical protein
MRYVDPTGQAAESPWDAANVTYDIWGICWWAVLYGKWVLEGNENYKQFGIEGMKNSAIDLGADSAALLIPGVPAGGTKIARALGKEVVGGWFIWRSPTKGSFGEITHTKLKSIFDRNYRPGAEYWNWSTADAIRYTKETGNSIHWWDHLQKGQDSINGLQKLLNWWSLNKADANTAKILLNDLKNALNGK